MSAWCRCGRAGSAEIPLLAVAGLTDEFRAIAEAAADGVANNEILLGDYTDGKLTKLIRTFTGAQ